MTERKIQLITIILDNTVKLLTEKLGHLTKKSREFLTILAALEELKK